MFQLLIIIVGYFLLHRLCYPIILVRLPNDDISFWANISAKTPILGCTSHTICVSLNFPGCTLMYI